MAVSWHQGHARPLKAQSSHGSEATRAHGSFCTALKQLDDEVVRELSRRVGVLASQSGSSHGVAGGFLFGGPTKTTLPSASMLSRRAFGPEPNAFQLKKTPRRSCGCECCVG